MADIHPVISIDAGVYAAKVKVAGKTLAAMLYCGNRPTLNLTEPVIELHLLDFHGDLYGQQVEFVVLDRVRGEQKFASVDELAAQLRADELAIRRLLNL